ADRVFFLHAAAWSSDNGQEGFRYVINYSDGTKAEIPIRDGIEVGEWYWPLKRIDGMKFVPGFVNVERRGVFVYEWKNPYPQKTISTIDIVSADTKLIPIIVGITIEQPDKTRKITPLLTGKLKVKEWGGVKTVVHPDRYEIGITENGRAWCGVGLTATPSVPLPPDATKLVFEVNGAKDQWGRSGILAAPFQVTVYGLDAEGKFPKVKYVTTPYDFKVDDKPETWQKLELPLDRMLGEGVVNITGMGIQYRILPAERAGIEIRNIHLE
ncbi:MAG: hypothetical protein LBM70_08610, partial [Victivallales bacterium]|nr:hypothetical protein [Victivallales bacterium]